MRISQPCAARTHLRILIELLACLMALPLAHSASVPTLALEEAINIGERRSARLAAQSAAVAAAAEQVPRVTELPDPKLRFGIDNLPITDSDAFSVNRDFMTMRRIGYMQDVPHADKRKARGTRAAREREVEFANLVAQHAQVRQDIALAWLELYYAQQSERVLEELLESYKLEADTAGPAVSAGRVTPSAVIAARASVENVRDRMLGQSRAAARARAMLEALVGDAARRRLGPPPDMTVLAHAPAALLNEIEGHPAQRIFEVREALAESEVALAASSRKPDWSWEVSFGNREPRFSNMVTFMVSIDLPLNKRDRQDRDVTTRVKQLEQARAQREDARRMHEAEVRSLVSDWQIAGERATRFDKNLLPLARERAELALAAYRGGRGELATVLESRRVESDVQLSRLDAELERARAWARLNFLIFRADEPHIHGDKP